MLSKNHTKNHTKNQSSVYIIELTVPWEAAVEEAFERKSLKYTELAADAEQRGWKAKVCPVEVGCRGFVGNSTIWACKVKPYGEPSKPSQAQQKKQADGFG
ncbi:hypothetical protein DPEC_G00060290 [Dallia pectoralis]|uniref:Uncharacterized protein n=1 Tax=Dallia pectoralis TaxID=75939 RepID=A0ACC2H7Y2_DALPE|nr:hypothetical protein DPEC_G00060290 [Dallia pectoralis]